jgi:UDP-N-acetylmuramyl pentapeptide phosphotransferase/UDP-N-acetylglucosamine-1-phosphate transferase
MQPLLLFALAVAAFLLALGITRWLIDRLTARRMLDAVNHRSSHTVPTPRGGGWGVLAGLVPAWLAVAWITGVGFGFAGPVIAIAFAGLVWVSWRDDLGATSWRFRLIVHALAVCAGLLMFAPFALYAGSTERLALVVLVAAVLAVLWVGFLNAFNFIDGIDGIASAQAIVMGIGAAIVFAQLGAHPAYVAFALTLAAAAAGFLVWNRPPARIFLGDVGSVPLGYLSGFLLVALAVEGAWGAALVLPAYIGADTVLTMLQRWRRGARLTEAHREHAYQRAAGRTKSGHARALRLIVGGQLALVALAAVLGPGEWPSQLALIACGAVVVGVLLVNLDRIARARIAGGEAP